MKRIETTPEFWGKPLTQPGILWRDVDSNVVYIMREGVRLERIDSDIYNHDFTFSVKK